MLENPLPHSHKLFKLINGDSTDLQNTKILIIGVGGIGCQILKVLCKIPIGTVHIIDMDTIELSNLNRQFLFKKEHKGMSKSLVARQTILKINPDFDIVAHHKNIKELPINFFKDFNFLVMALDNIEARNYVNKIGVRLNIPIIDAGTLGYKGNVTTIIPGQTKCYSCNPKSSQQKVFPVCTIRMRPQKPIHCIVWAKLLFEVLFGPENDDNDLKDLSELAKNNDVLDIMVKLFQTDILEIKNAKQDSDNKLSQLFAKSIKTISKEELQKHIKTFSIQSFNKHQEKVSIEQSISIFYESFQRLNEQKIQDAVITFQKDDDNIIHFISSAANLRMYCFNIDRQSFNEVKNMAGNIVPAIASTNSIVSGIEIVEMMKLIKKNKSKMRTYFVQNLNTKVIALPNEQSLQSCQVCHPSSIPVIISANLSNYTLQNFVTLINQKAPFLQQFSINYGSKQYYNSDEPNQALLQKSVMELCSAYEIDLVVTNEDTMRKHCLIWLIHDQKQGNMVKIKNQEQLLKKPEPGQEDEQIQQEQKQQAGQDDDSGIEMFDDQDSPDIQIIQVKKNPIQSTQTTTINQLNHQGQQKNQVTDIILQTNQVQIVDSANQVSEIPNEQHSQIQKRQPQPISAEQGSSDSIKKKVKPNEQE